MGNSTSNERQARRELEEQLSDERQAFQYRMQGLVRKNGELSREKGELRKQLEEKTRMARVYSSKVSTLEYKVIELSVEKGKVEKQLEDTRNVGVLFMNAADEYQEVVEREIKTVVQELKDTKTMGVMLMNAADKYQDIVEKEFTIKVDELKDTRNVGLLFMNAADEYQEEVEKDFKAVSKELNDTRMAGMLFMNAADDYQEVVEKEYKAKVEELKGTRMAGLLLMNEANEYQEVLEKEYKLKLRELEELWAQNMKMDMRVTSLESELKVAAVKKEEWEADDTVKMEYEVVKGESGKVHLEVSTLEHQLDVEVKKHKMEVCLLEEENETNVKAFNVEKAEKMKESQYIKRIVEEIKAGNEFIKGGENDRLQLQVFNVEHTHRPSEIEVSMHNMEFGVSEETKILNAKNIQVMKESGHFKRKAEEIHTCQDLVGDKNHTPIAETFDDIAKI